MKSTAKLRYLRIAPRKVRLVADLIRGKRVSEAQQILSFTTKRAALPLLKLLNSAVAGAKQKFSADESNLYISKIIVDEGPKLKRFMPRARGQAYEIQKKTSHVLLELTEIVAGKKVELTEETGKKGIQKIQAEKEEKPKFEIERKEQKRFKVPILGRRIFRRKAI